MSIQFPYPGGKAKIRSKLYPYFPEEGRGYLEPFAGRGNVFWEWYPISDYEFYTINDLKVSRFFEALRDVNLEDLPFSITEEEFDVWYNRWLRDEPLAFVVEPKITFRGKGYLSGWQKGRYKRARYKPMCESAQHILRDKRVMIRNRDYVFLPWQDFNEDDFVYMDPPYYETGGVALGQIDHIQLLQILTDAKFQWAVSGYLSDLYLTWLGEPCLKLERKLEMTDAKGSTSIECLWTNA